MPISVTDDSTHHPVKKGSDLVKLDVVGIADKRYLVVNIGDLILIDTHTGDSLGKVDAGATYDVFAGDLNITDAPAPAAG